jgi:hypothetical protein
VEIGKRRLKVQALPLSKPNLILKRQFMKKKTHGRADARGLTGAKLTNKVLIIKERAEQTMAPTAKRSKTRAVTPEEESADKDISLILDIPPTQQPWES